MVTKRSRAIFLDRDGILNKAIVINKKPKSPKNLSELVLNKSLKKFLLDAKKSYYLICVTNQPEVGRKKFSKTEIKKINNFIKVFFNLDDIFTCYHEKDNICNCRKPKIGLLLKSKKKYNINLKKSIVIGDRWKDIAMGKKAGCKTIFVDYNYNENLKDRPDVTVNNIKKLINHVYF
jgi:D-glycero-D-manno-heptose 1,7-bisphosphate phosphatase